jgi:DNA-binding LacI/PurR family transcriptional regulator
MTTTTEDTRAARVRELLRRDLVLPLRATGGRLPSNRVLAARYGVTTNTIGKALQDLVVHGLVRVRVGAGSFVLPQTQAPAVALLSSGAIADGRPEFQAFALLDAELQRQLRALGHSCRHIIDLRDQAARAAPLPELVEAVHRGEISGVILVRGDPLYRDRWLDGLPVPVATWQRPMGTAGVWLDLRDAGRRAGQCLLRRGIRRIACLGPILCEDDHPAQAAMYNMPLRAGLADALAEVGAPAPAAWHKARMPADLIRDWPATSLRERGRRCAELVLREGGHEAMVCFPDAMAVGCAEALRTAGIPDRDLPLLVIGSSGLTLEGLADRTHLEAPLADVARALIAGALTTAGAPPLSQRVAYTIRPGGPHADPARIVATPRRAPPARPARRSDHRRRSGPSAG